MRITVKCIIKWGLIAEILAAIIGQVGEITLRYRSYSSAFDQLFGRYRINDQISRQEFVLDTKTISVDVVHTPIKIDPNSMHYDHRMVASSEKVTNVPKLDQPVALQSKYNNRTEMTTTNDTDTVPTKSTLLNIISSVLQTSISVPKNKSHPSTLFNFDTYSSPASEIVDVSKPLDPRPLLICAILTCLNLLFIIGILIENLKLICPLTIVWLLYLILVLLVLHAGNTDIGPNMFGRSPWSTLAPSPFTILVESIILVFSLVLIAMIVEEKRQFAIRIRAKSAAIPLVKSRDMDLDEI
ncbi:hypothetical protein BLOT_005140 [Blomia tropicalis]|nr:hypothetical protein BLOT_005140 [Blomia tropicalis]